MSDPLDQYNCGDIEHWAPIVGDAAERKAREVILDFDGWLADHGFKIMQVAEIEKSIAKALRSLP